MTLPVPTMVAAVMSEIANHTGKEPWLSLETASWWFDKSSVVLAISLFFGFVCTVIIIVTGIIKEHHWDIARETANKEIAGLNRGTARLQSDNLALQTVLLPRSIGAIGVNQRPPAETWFAGFERWAGIKVLIQVIPGDAEARNLANEIAIVLASRGWRPEFIDEKRSGVSMNLREGLEIMSPSSFKGYDPKNAEQETFRKLGNAARSLATALTRAGLGVGPYPVSGVNGLNMIVDFPPDSPAAISNPYRNFLPQLDGVYLQVGSRPVTATLQWIKQGRPNEAGIRPDEAGPVETHK